MVKDDKKNITETNPKKQQNWKDRWTPSKIKNYKNEVYRHLSTLLLENFSEIEKYVEGGSFESIQKTL